MLPKNKMFYTITDITRHYRVRTYVIETWVSEGRFPAYVTRNQYKYWYAHIVDDFISQQSSPEVSLKTVTSSSSSNANWIPWIVCVAIGSFVANYLY